MFRGHSRSLKVNNIYNTSKKQKFKFLSQVMKFQRDNYVLSFKVIQGHRRSKVPKMCQKGEKFNIFPSFERKRPNENLEMSLKDNYFERSFKVT